jgi:hypothetical protein
MIIVGGFWLSLIDEHRQRVLYQVATDRLTDEEFLSLWHQAGKTILRELNSSKESALEFRIRAQRNEGGSAG